MARDLYAAAAARLADVVTFYAAATVVPIEREVNPLARAVVGIAGLGGVLILEMLLLGASLWLLTRMRQAPEWARLTGLSLCVGSGLAGAAANLTTLALALR